MNALLDLLFLMNVGMLCIGHEMDAVRQKEWRLLFNWTGLSDEAQYRLFVVLHLPLFVWIIWQWKVPSFQIGFDIFLLLHAMVHYLLRDNPLVNFGSFFSRFWIYGAALIGAAHLYFMLVDQQRVLSL